ncbi:MAG: adenylosuccinate lyase [Elusimicrobia bacterium]|nr:adenylosuccinate lyase [Candidatus Liberimonas magnetica]
MIPRYSRKEMSDIWSEENKFNKMLEVEILACEAMSKKGIIPKADVNQIRKKASVDIKRINKIEETVKHDVIAFLTQVGEKVGPSSRYIHLGMTSSDVLDTALSVQMKESCGLLLKGAKELASTIKKLALKYKNTPMIGRTHGIHAEPMTFGLKMASWYSEMKRVIALLENTKETISYGNISGAVGTFAHLSPDVESYVCRKIGLKPEPVSTQVIPRDRHAIYLCRIALIGASLERFATEIRHLQRTEVMEAEEPFTKGQKGSSAMPHKRNPILSENICGLARLLRGYAVAGMENVALWHERDISHSSAERVALADASILLDFMFARMNKILSGLVVYPQNMARNLKTFQDAIFSGTLLLALVKKGLTREKSYDIVQKAAFQAREKNISLEKCALTEKNISNLLKPQEIKASFDIKSHFKHIPYIFSRVFQDNNG